MIGAPNPITLLITCAGARFGLSPGNGFCAARFCATMPPRPCPASQINAGFCGEVGGQVSLGACARPAALSAPASTLPMPLSIKAPGVPALAPAAPASGGCEVQ